MCRIGLLDVDGHNFPNLALMKLSAWHKAKGDAVEFADPMFGRYDRVYLSKVFTFSPDCPDIYRCETVRGGTGFRDYATVLPEEVEHTCPDYELYGVEEAYGFLTRGCQNRCPWCIVPQKEGAIRPASPIHEFIGDKRRAVLLDNNVLASDWGLEQIEEIVRMGIAVDFNQGLDARRACDDRYILDLLARVKWIRHIRFACDTVAQLEPVVRCVKELERRGVGRHRFFVYCLVKEIDDALVRLNALRKLRINPFAQPYRDYESNAEPTREQRQLAWWCNQKQAFYGCEYRDFRPHLPPHPKRNAPSVGEEILKLMHEPHLANRVAPVGDADEEVVDHAVHVEVRLAGHDPANGVEPKPQPAEQVGRERKRRKVGGADVTDAPGRGVRMGVDSFHKDALDDDDSTVVQHIVADA